MKRANPVVSLFQRFDRYILVLFDRFLIERNVNSGETYFKSNSYHAQRRKPHPLSGSHAKIYFPNKCKRLQTMDIGMSSADAL
jgi:hypothetical protein